MMFVFGKRSRRNIDTLDKDIQDVLYEDIKTAPIDYSVLIGYRGEKLQNKAYASGNGLKWPNSFHNVSPSMAFDFAPYHRTNPHIRWDDVDSFVKVADHIIKTAERMGIELRSGSDWDQDGKYREDGEYDGPHIEKVK